MDKQNLFLNGGLTMPYGSEFFNPSWENPVDQNDPFESALSSMVSSPAASNVAGPAAANESVRNQVFVLRELIGRLDSFENSGEISPAGRANNSSHNNSPLKLNLSSMADHQIRGANFPIHPDLSQHFSTDPGFAERAARFSCFSDKGLMNSSTGNQSIKANGSQLATIQANSELGDSRENSTVSEQIPIGKNDTNSRKRKAASKGKAKEITAAAPSTSSAKRTKSDEENDKDSCGTAAGENKANPKAAEPPKDYIHVRARRGQATDAHSLAERVRREKISERMKLLQDLVPGCNKVTGKAVMLDEIINYVQSLQRQVEFLSMKLATVNPRTEFNMEALLSKEVYQYAGSPIQPYSFQSQPSIPNLQAVLPKGPEVSFPINSIRNQGLALSHMDNFLDPASQVPAFFEDDLSSVVQMGFGQNQTHNFHGALGTSEMKAEL